MSVFNLGCLQWNKCEYHQFPGICNGCKRNPRTQGYSENRRFKLLDLYNEKGEKLATNIEVIEVIEDETPRG